MARSDPKPDIARLVRDTNACTQAMRAGVAEEIRRKKALGYPIVVWRDGDVVEIPAEDLPESGYYAED
jgi:hypothetical protein